MNTASSVLADAMALLGEDLFVHLDEADALAQIDEWSTEDSDRARKLIDDLVQMIRGLLIEHERQPDGECQTCARAWPCPVVITIHGFLKDPNRQFAALLTRPRERDN